MSERTLHAKDFEHSMIVELLKETSLLNTLSKLPTFVLQIVIEFYVNLSKDMGNPASPNFQRMIVRGHTFEFSPSIIYQYLSCLDVPDNEVEVPEIDPMVSIIIRGKVKTWSYKYNLHSSYLTSNTSFRTK